MKIKKTVIITFIVVALCVTGYIGYQYYRKYSLTAFGYRVSNQNNPFRGTNGFENYSEADIKNINVDPRLMKGKVITQSIAVTDKTLLHKPAFYKAVLVNTVIPSGEIGAVNFRIKQPYPNVFYLFAKDKNDLTAKDYAVIFVPRNGTMQTYIFAIAQVYMPIAIQSRLRPFIDKYAIKD
jgi:hypothetical protein